MGPVSTTQVLAAFSGDRATIHSPGAAFLLAAALAALTLVSLMLQLRKQPPAPRLAEPQQ